MTKHLLHSFGHCPKCGSTVFHINDSKSKKCGECGFTYYLNPAAATVAVISNGKGEVLVAVRAKEPKKGTLDLPGGFCDSYESAEEGVERETREETGLVVESTRYLFSIPNIYPYSGMDIHTMDMFFLCYVNDCTSLRADDDVASLKWIAIEELNEEEFGLCSIKKGIKRIKEMYKNNLLEI